jgi:hypothetical protein
MLIENKCSIYEDRPRTCRNYDCRVFAATGLRPSEDSKRLITERTRHWRFDYPGERDRTEHSAVRAAAKFLREHAGAFRGGLPGTSTQLALLAIKVYKVFLRYVGLDSAGQKPPASEVVEEIIAANQQFKATRDALSR